MKNVEKLAIWPAMQQALTDAAAGQIAVVAHTKNNHGFLVTLPAEEFLDILRRSDLVVQPEPKSLKLESEDVVA